MRRFAARLLEFLRLTRRDADARREIDAHLALMQDDFESRGLSPDAARRAARLAFGGIEQAREAHRDARSFPSLEAARQDVALGVRLLRRSPLFTITAAASLAIGLGANTAIFAVANSLLFRPPGGIQRADRLVDIGAARGDGGLNPIPFARYRDIAHGVTALSGVFAEEMFPHAMSMRASEGADAERITGQAVSATFFDVLGARPHVGRLFTETDEAAATAGVLDYDFWNRRFGGDARLVGRLLRINDRAITIVGVTARRFDGTHVQKRDVWLILPPSRRASVMVGGRLRDGASVAEVAAQVAAVAAAVAPGNAAERSHTTALPFSRAGGNRVVVAAFSAALMALVSLVLAIAGANVAGITIARSNARQGELALRTALGATRGRLLRQLLTEIGVLFAAAGVAGILLAWIVIGSVRAASLVPGVSIIIDWRVVSFAIALTLAAAILSGVVPAVRGSQAQPATVLKNGSQASHGGSRSRAMFVSGQVAISVVLVALSGLLVRAVRLAGLSEPGFDPQDVALTTLDLSMAGRMPAAPDEFWRDVLDRARRVPGVEAASLARVPPGGWEGIGLGGVDVTDHPGRLVGFTPSWNIVEPGYFATLRIPIRRGRDFSPADTAHSPPVVIIAASLARRCWPGEDATGRYLTLSTFNPQTSRWQKTAALVVGVVGDIKSSSLIDGFADPYVYLPVAQIANTDFTKTMTIVTRSRNPGITLQAQIERTVRDIDPDLVAAQAALLADAIRLGLAPQRTLATAAGALGVVALLLASIGIYGAMAYNVASRRREIGIRMALGAPRAAIVWIVARQAVCIVAAGTILGLALATGLGRGLSVFVYGLQAAHAATFLVTLAIVATVSGVACYVPTRQAIGVEPLQALRTD